MSTEVSIIIPVYNGERSIAISLDSLLDQTYSNWEVIIIDDGSQDSTAKVINEYINNDSRFKYQYQRNSGYQLLEIKA